MTCDSGSRAERQDRNGLGPEDGRTAPVEGHRPTSGATQEIINRLKERYTAEPVPPCQVCGAALTIASAGGGEATKWVCSVASREFGPDSSEHYHASEWRQLRPGDNDVLALLSTLTNLTPSGVERIRAEAFEEAAAWHDQRYRDTPDAFEMEFHDVSRKAIRALALPSEPPQPISSKKLIALLDDPRIAAAVNDRGAYGKAASEPPRQVCPHCNDTGDVHRADGEWLGKCDCGAQPPSQGDVEGRAREMLATQVYDKLPKKGREPYYSLSAIRLILDTARGFTTGTCHACSYDNADREWPLRLDTGVRGALEAASRLIQQMDRDKAWISADVSAVIGQIAETLASKEDGRS